MLGLIFGLAGFVAIAKVVLFSPPQFFPLDNPNGSYKITKGCPSRQGWWETGAAGMKYGDGYCVEYRGANVFDPQHTNTNFYRVTVGASRQDLRPFLNRSVTITSGRFDSADTQCIAGACVALGGTGTVLTLRSIKIRGEQR